MTIYEQELIDSHINEEDITEEARECFSLMMEEIFYERNHKKYMVDFLGEYL